MSVWRAAGLAAVVALASPAAAQPDPAALMTEGGALLAQHDPRDAVDRYTAALQAWQASGDEPHEVEALVALATAHVQLGQTDEATALLTRSGERARSAGDKLAEAKTLAAQAALHDAMGQPQPALDAARQAADLLHALDRPAEEGPMRLSQGTLASKLHDTAGAVAAYVQAAPLFHATGERRGEALALLRAGQTSVMLNKSEGFEQGAAYLAQAAALFEALSDNFSLSYALWGEGTANDRLGRKAAARDAYARALPLFAEPHDKASRARILLSLGQDEAALGQPASARDHYEQALPLFDAPGDAFSRGLTLLQLGSVRDQLADPAGAIAAYTDAAAVWHGVGDAASEATAHLKIGALHAAAGDWEAALDADQAALALQEAAGNAAGQATALISIAGVHQARGDLRHALEAAERSAGLLDGDALAVPRSVALLVAGSAASGLHDYPRAFGYLDQVVALGARNPGGKAGALATEAGMYTAMGEPAKALDLLDQALAVVQPGNREGATNRIRGDRAMALYALGREDEALTMFEAALASARAGDRPQQEATTLNNMAQIRQGFGDTQMAVDLYGQALAVARRIGDRDLEATTLSNQAMAWHALGDDAEAFATLDAALALHRALGDRHGEAISLNNLALIYNDTGEPQKALDTYARAKDALGDAADPNDAAVALNNAGSVYRGLGATDRARSYFRQALAIHEQAGDDEGRATALNNLAVAAQTDGEPQEALRLYAQALDLAVKLGIRPQQASLLSGMGVAYSAAGQHDTAVDYLGRSLAVARSTGNRNAEALALHNLGTEYERAGDLAAALDHLRQALALWRQVQGVEGEATALYVIARIEAAQGALDAALADVEQSIVLRESLRSRLGSEDLRASLLSGATRAYGLKIDLLMRLDALQPGKGHAAAALETSERGRARSLLDLLAQSHADIRRGVDPARLATEQAIRRSLSAKAVQQAKLAPDAPAFAQLDHEIAALTAQYEAVEGEIRAASPAYAALTQPAPLTLPQIQALLDPGTVLLEYALGTERSHVWLVTPTGLQAFALPPQDSILAAARDLQRALPDVANPHGTDAPAAKLGAMLLGPVAGALGHKRLVVVSDAALQAAVPFAMLVPPHTRQPLIVDHEIVQEPSASAVAALRQGTAGRARPPGSVAVLADPVFSADDARLHLRDAPPQGVLHEVARAATRGGDLDRLPSTREEARSILASARGGRTLARLDFDASKQAATDPALGGYGIVHFATHGLIDQEHPELSGLVFSLFAADGAPRDGYLRLTDIFNLSLPVDLVVLSACESGQGRVVGGEGLVGLTQGFFYAGSAALVVSLWSVDDRATAALMARLYGAMLGHPRLHPAAALRQAQLAMLAGPWRHPWYWAPFVAEGEWR